MDCVILAAGRGSRLRGVVPQYFKPLMTVDGQAMIVRLVDEVRGTENIDRTIIVVAPENTAPIIELLEANHLITDETFFIVQPDANGPGAGLCLAASLVQTEKALVLMSDNILRRYDLNKFTQEEHQEDVVIGGRLESSPDVACRFTRVGYLGDTYEGPIDPMENMHSVTDFFIWLGPLLVRMAELPRLIWGHGLVGEEVKIGPVLGHIGTVKTIVCDAHDVGDLNGT